MESRLFYLCSRIAKSEITLDEYSELLGYIAVDPRLKKMIAFERVMHENKWFFGGQ